MGVRCGEPVLPEWPESIPKKIFSPVAVSEIFLILTESSDFEGAV